MLQLNLQKKDGVKVRQEVMMGSKVTGLTSPGCSPAADPLDKAPC